MCYLKTTILCLSMFLTLNGYACSGNGQPCSGEPGSQSCCSGLTCTPQGCQQPQS